MKIFFSCVVALVLLGGCKQCIECKYATNKGSEVTKFCSSTKADRDAFEAVQNQDAMNNGSVAICTKEKY